jgi:hypothetical protein
MKLKRAPIAKYADVIILAADSDPADIAAAITAMIDDPAYQRSAVQMAQRIAHTEGDAARLAEVLLP